MKASTLPRGDTLRVRRQARLPCDPHPGFKPFEGIARTCNGKFMSGQMVRRGGSVATPPGHKRQFSGIRLAKDI